MDELDILLSPDGAKNHYIDNQEFCKAMVEWKALSDEAEASGEPRPPVSEYIGGCFLKIAQGLAKKPKFKNPTAQACIEDMISDGVENCLMYCYNFDPEKSRNPFSYFTQITYFAFLRRIQKERKQTIIKYKYLESLDRKGEFTDMLKMMGITQDTEVAPTKKKKAKTKVSKKETKQTLEDLM